jgi:hypothetical protein
VLVCFFSEKDFFFEIYKSVLRPLKKNYKNFIFMNDDSAQQNQQQQHHTRHVTIQVSNFDEEKKQQQQQSNTNSEDMISKSSNITQQQSSSSGSVAVFDVNSIAPENLCTGCHKAPIEFAASNCQHRLFCRKCSMKVASGGKCRICGEWYADLKRCSTTV